MPRPHVLPRFKLRTVLAAIALIAVALGFWGNRANRQRWAIEQIRSCGNQSAVFFDYDDLDSRERGVLSRLPDWCQTAAGPDFFSIPSLVQIYEPPDNRWVLAVNSIASIKTLNLMGENISNRDLARLGNLTQLTELCLFQTAVTDEGLAAILSFPHLRRLRIAETNITSLSYARFEKCRELKELEFCETALADDAVPYLSRLVQLERLQVQNSGISDWGVESLRKALPNCDIW